MSENIFPSLPIEYIEKHVIYVQEQLAKRWKAVKALKSSFVPYFPKSEDEIGEEFNKLHAFRQRLWYLDPDASPRIVCADYLPAQKILASANYRMINNVAFDYNLTDDYYNASTVLILRHAFIALQEPNDITLNQFFKVLINHRAGILVRVKTANEFLEYGAVKYWENRLKKNQDYHSLQMIIKDYYNPVEPVEIPYFYTDSWVDNKSLDIPDLYNLVSSVYHTHQSLFPEGAPIACHCASGVGRTGTFIAAYVLADLIHKGQIKDLGIEEIVLKLSIQRPNLVGTLEQYLSLYKFVEYCLEKHSS